MTAVSSSSSSPTAAFAEQPQPAAVDPSAVRCWSPCCLSEIDEESCVSTADKELEEEEDDRIPHHRNIHAVPLLSLYSSYALQHRRYYSNHNHHKLHDLETECEDEDLPTLTSFSFSSLSADTGPSLVRFQPTRLAVAQSPIINKNERNENGLISTLLEFDNDIDDWNCCHSSSSSSSSDGDEEAKEGLLSHELLSPTEQTLKPQRRTLSRRTGVNTMVLLWLFGAVLAFSGRFLCGGNGIVRVDPYEYPYSRIVVSSCSTVQQLLHTTTEVFESTRYYQRATLSLYVQEFRRGSRFVIGELSKRTVQMQQRVQGQVQALSSALLRSGAIVHTTTTCAAATAVKVCCDGLDRALSNIHGVILLLVGDEEEPAVVVEEESTSESAEMIKQLSLYDWIMTQATAMRTSVFAVSRMTRRRVVESRASSFVHSLCHHSRTKITSRSSDRDSNSDYDNSSMSWQEAVHVVNKDVISPVLLLWNEEESNEEEKEEESPSLSLSGRRVLDNDTITRTTTLLVSIPTETETSTSSEAPKLSSTDEEEEEAEEATTVLTQLPEESTSCIITPLEIISTLRITSTALVEVGAGAELGVVDEESESLHITNEDKEKDEDAVSILQQDDLKQQQLQEEEEKEVVEVEEPMWAEKIQALFENMRESHRRMIHAWEMKFVELWSSNHEGIVEEDSDTSSSSSLASWMEAVKQQSQQQALRLLHEDEDEASSYLQGLFLESLEREVNKLPVVRIPVSDV